MNYSSKITVALLLLFLFSGILSLAQTGDILSSDPEETLGCAVDHFHQLRMDTDPQYRQAFEKTNKQLRNTILEKMRNRADGINQRSNPSAPCIPPTGEEILTVPVVVFIVHPTALATPTHNTANPTDAQIIQGIQDLNDAFRNVGVYAGHGHGALDAANPDRAFLESVDVEIEFCLAQRDINGNATSGIYRTPNDTYADLDLDAEIDDMKAFVESQIGGALFPDSDYAGIWLHDKLCSSGSLGCGIGGYAGPGLGVLNLARLFGSSTNGSKTHIHEFGHYLNVWHTFDTDPATGCDNTDCLLDGDYVCDTPPDNSTASAGSCGIALNTCSTDLDSGPFTVDQDDMYENYMDYSRSDCKNTFTQGQKDRMRASLLGRSSLLASKGCINPVMLEAGINAVAYPSSSVCDLSFNPILNIENNGNTTITSIDFDVTVDGGGAIPLSNTVSIAPDANGAIVLDPVTIAGTGDHTLYFEITMINGSAADTYARNNYYCQSFSYYPAVNTLDYCTDLETGVLPAEWAIDNPDNGIGFELKNISTCANNGDYVIALETYESNPSATTTDALFTQTLDLSNYLSPVLNFDYAYTSWYSNSATDLAVSVSLDCGTTYTDLVSGALAKSVASNSADDPAFVPADCSQWLAHNTINLETYGGLSEVLIRFQASATTNNPTYNTWGNNLYLDNICVEGTACIPLNNTSSAPGTITACGSSTDLGLDVDNYAAAADPAKEVIGWWITKDNPITATATDIPTTQSALAGATVGGALADAANIIYEGDNTTGSHTLPIDCNNLTGGATYYATPFISGKEATIPDQSCNDLQGNGGQTSVNSGDYDGSITAVNFASCTPVPTPNNPTFNLTINLTNYTETLPSSLSLRIRNGANTNIINENLSVTGLPMVLSFTEADFPNGYNPKEDGLKIFFINFNSAFTSGSPTIQFDYDLDISYAGQAEIAFPSIGYNGCSFGTPVTFVCDCASVCTAPTNIATATGTYVATSECTDALGWTHYWDNMNGTDNDSDDLLLFSMKKNGNDIGEVGDGTFELKVGVDPTAGTGAVHIPVSVPYVLNRDGWYVMDRYWDVTPTEQPTSDIDVRFYHTFQDFTDVDNEVALGGATEMVFYKTQGTANPDPSMGHAGITSPEVVLYPQEGVDWTLSGYASDFYAEMAVSSFSGGGGGGGFCTGCGPLPVDLLYFDARKLREEVLLEWETVSETNSDSYLVEHSTDAGSFELVGKQSAAGNSSGSIRYSFIHENPAAGINYYRLKQVDKDGLVEIFGPRTVTFRETGSIDIHPVPSKEGTELTIICEAANSGMMEWRITDVTGKQIQSGKESVSAGPNHIPLGSRGLPSGMYLVNIKLEGLARTRRIIIY